MPAKFLLIVLLLYILRAGGRGVQALDFRSGGRGFEPQKGHLVVSGRASDLKSQPLQSKSSSNRGTFPAPNEIYFPWGLIVEVKSSFFLYSMGHTEALLLQYSDTLGLQQTFPDT